MGKDYELEKLDLGLIQFYWRTTSSQGIPKNPFPDFLPFSFSINEELGLVIQSPSDIVDSSLDVIYRQPDNVGYLQDGHALAESYGQDFLRFADKQLAGRKPGTVLEIGSGAAWLLSQFSKRGWQGIGCDPSPFAAKATFALGFEHLSCFYSGEVDIKPVDLIIHYDVLEHVRNPVEFLELNRSHLGPEGRIIFAVPDCTQQIIAGDISMVLHEHVNYFSESSLRRVVEAAGLEVIDIRPGDTGGVLFCVAKLTSGIRDSGINLAQNSSSENLEKGWLERAARTKATFDDLVVKSLEAKGPIGLYIPLRAFPYLGQKVTDLDLVLIDDDPGVRGRFFDGVNSPILGSEVLDQRKFSVIVALTFSYEKAITQRVRSSYLNSKTPVVSPGSMKYLLGTF